MLISYRIAVALVTTAVLSSCGATIAKSGFEADGQDSAAAETALIGALINREAIVQRSAPLTFTDLFPPGGRSEVLATAFRAEVISVDAGRGFGDHLDGTPGSGIEVLAFDDPRANWRSFELHLKILESFWGDAKAGDEVTVGLAFGTDMDWSVVSEGFKHMDQVVAFTAKGGFIVPYDPNIKPILWDGAFLSPMEGDQVPWPTLAGKGEEASVVSGFDTLAELRRLGP